MIFLLLPVEHLIQNTTPEKEEWT